MTAVACVSLPADRAAGIPAIDRAAPARRGEWRRAALVVLAAMLGVEVMLAVPYFRGTVSDLYRCDPRWLALAVIVQLLSMSAFARVQRRMLAAGGPRVPMRRMLALTYAANALGVTFPGGVAMSSGYVFRRLRSWGATVPAAGFTVLASAMLSTLSFGLLAVACAVLAGNGGPSSLAVIVGAAVAAIVVLSRRRRHDPNRLLRLAGRAIVRTNRIFHRAPDAGLGGLRRAVGGLSAIQPRSRYLAGKAAASLSLLPGGLGAVDAAMVFALTQGGVSSLSAAAEVLIYRLISLALVVSLGWLIWGATWVGDRRRPVPSGLQETPIRTGTRGLGR
jgi:putative heme transporter